MYKYLARIMYGLVFTPKEAWRALSKIENKREGLLNRYLFPIMGITALTAFVGVFLFSSDISLEKAFKQVIVRIATVGGSFFLGSFILNEIFPRFGIKRNLVLAQTVVGYSSALIYFLYIAVPLLSDFFFLWLLSLYSINIVSNVVPTYIQVNERAKANFVVVTTAIVVFMPLLTALVLSFIIK